MLDACLVIIAKVVKAQAVVYEDGAKLASVTGNGYVSSPGIDGVYRIDRPFVYILRDVSGSVLIAGWVNNPLK